MSDTTTIIDVSKGKVKEQPTGLIKKQTIVFEKSYGSVTLREFANNCDGAYLITGFTSTNLTSILSAGFLAEALSLPLIGTILSHSFVPRTVIEKAQPAHPIRIYGDNRLVICLCEFQLTPDQTYSVCDALLDFARRHHCPLALAVEGYPTDQLFDLTEEHHAPLYYLSTVENFNARMSEMGHKPVYEGMIKGIAGVLLAEGAAHDVDVGCLLGPSSTHYPDARGAVYVVKAILRLLGLDALVDVTPLEEKAATFEKSVRRMLDQEARGTRSLAHTMYG